MGLDLVQRRGCTVCKGPLVGKGQSGDDHDDHVGSGSNLSNCSSGQFPEAINSIARHTSLCSQRCASGRLANSPSKYTIGSTITGKSAADPRSRGGVSVIDIQGSRGQSVASARSCGTGADGRNSHCPMGMTSNVTPAARCLSTLSILEISLSGSGV